MDLITSAIIAADKQFVHNLMNKLSAAMLYAGLFNQSGKDGEDLMQSLVDMEVLIKEHSLMLQQL